MYTLKKVSMFFLIAWLLIPLVSRAQETLFSDTFTGRNGQRPQYWEIVNAPDPAYWYLENGEFTTGNGDNLLVASGYSYAVVDYSNSDQWENYTIECQAWMLQRNGRIVIVGRWQDKNNHYAGVLECYEGNRVLKISRFVDGQETMLANTLHALDGAPLPQIEGGSSSVDAKSFRLSFNNNEITFTYDTTTLQVKDDTFSKGTAGLGQWYNYIYFDNFVVRSYTPESVTVVSGPVQTPAQIAIQEPREVISPAEPRISDTYQLLIARGLNRETAIDQRDQFLNWGYIPVNIAQREDGTYEVLVGAFPGRDEAMRARTAMEQEGLVVVDVVRRGEIAEMAPTISEVTERRVYRVMVGEFDDEVTALQLRDQMEDDGFVGVELVQSNGKYQVFSGGKFAQETEAHRLADYLNEEGYLFTTVVAMRPEETFETVIAGPVGFTAQPGAPEPSSVFAIPEEIKEMEEWRELTPEEREKVTDALESEQRIKYGSPLAQEIEELRKKLQDLTDSQSNILQTVRSKFDEQESRQRELSNLFMRADEAIDARQWDQALAYLQQAEQIDPSNATILLKRRAIDMGKKNLEFIGQDKLEEKFKKEIEEARKSAEDHERWGNLVTAISQWETIKSRTDPTSLDYQEATRKIGELRSKIKEQQEIEAAKSKRLETLGYVALGLIFIIGIGVILIMVITGRRQQKLIRQVQEITLKPQMELGEGQRLELPEQSVETTPAGEKKPAPPLATSPFEPPQKQAEPEVPVVEPSEEETIEEELAGAETEPARGEEEVPLSPFAGAEEKEEAQEEKTPVGSEEEQESTFDEVFGALSELEEERETAPRETKKEDEDILGDIESLFGEEKKEEVKTAEPKKPDIEEVPDIISLDSLDTDIKEEVQTGEKETAAAGEEEISLEPGEQAEEEVETPAGTRAPRAGEGEEVHVPSPVEVGAKETAGEKVEQPAAKSLPKPKKEKEEVVSSGQQQVVYEQGFDDEEVGASPRGWNGEYEYASLEVVDETPAPDSKHCLRFEKKTGAGSAYYYCRFPDVTGVVQIEFSLRCDDKNKYLLGVYIEKDGDFRQSIHTIIHRTEAQTTPSLRIHGEPVPYLFGSWHKIKYIIDLNDGTLDGYVDDKQVAKRVHLASNPKRLNTISIRDNLATTGILKLDNIRITRV